MDRTIILDPLLPWPVVAAAAALALAAVALALYRGLPGWWLRLLAGAAVIAALLGPSLQTEEREALSDIVVLLEDDTASSRVGERARQTAEAADAMAERLAARPNTEVRRVEVPDGEGDAGTLLMRALSDALSQEPRARVAGVVAVTDGRLHDPEAAPDLPAPFHVLLTGSEEDWDRRLSVLGAPAFAILDEEVMLTLRIDDDGAAPEAATAPLTISVDGGEPTTFEVPVGEDLELPVILPPRRAQRDPLRDARGRRRAHGAQQRRRDPDERRARPPPRAPGERRAPSGRADLAQPPEVRLGRGSRPLHHPAPAGEAGRRAGGRALADRLPDARAVPRQDRRVRPDRVRPLPACAASCPASTSTTSAATWWTVARCWWPPGPNTPPPTASRARPWARRCRPCPRGSS